MSEGFEPPLHVIANLFSRQAPSTTRTTHQINECKIKKNENKYYDLTAEKYFSHIHNLQKLAVL